MMLQISGFLLLVLWVPLTQSEDMQLGSDHQWLHIAHRCGCLLDGSSASLSALRSEVTKVHTFVVYYIYPLLN